MHGFLIFVHVFCVVKKYETCKQGGPGTTQKNYQRTKNAELSDVQTCMVTEID